MRSSGLIQEEIIFIVIAIVIFIVRIIAIVMFLLQLFWLKLEENTIELSPKLDRERAKDPLCFGQTLRKLKKMKDETEKQNSYNLTPPDGVGYIERHTGDNVPETC